MTFARIKEAAEPLDPSGWSFLVLTLDRNAYFGGRRWLDVNEAYRELGAMSRSLLQRIGRVWGPESVLERNGRGKALRTVRKLGPRWVAVVEAHRSGWPHVNVMLWAPELAEELRRAERAALEDPEVADAVALSRECWRDKRAVPASVRERARRAALVSGPLREMLIEAGWGVQSTAEAARSADAVAGYVTKVAGLHDASAGELAKVTQVPANAPERFRRLRSGRGFLPPRRKNPAVTGCLIRRRVSAEGDWEIVACNAPKEPEHAPAVEAARAAESKLIAEEETLRSRDKRGRLPAMPPRRLSLAGQLEPHWETSERASAVRSRRLACAG